VTTTARAPRIATAGGREVRTFSTRLEARDDGALEFKLDGYASTFEQPHEMGGYTEVISRGAFRDTLALRPDVQLLTNHEGLPLARTTIPPGQPGHLSLSEDFRGLRVSAQLDRSDPDAATLGKKRSGPGFSIRCPSPSR
jgi:phage head maturation protease